MQTVVARSSPIAQEVEQFGQVSTGKGGRGTGIFFSLLQTLKTDAGGIGSRSNRPTTMLCTQAQTRQSKEKTNAGRKVGGGGKVYQRWGIRGGGEQPNPEPPALKLLLGWQGNNPLPPPPPLPLAVVVCDRARHRSKARGVAVDTWENFVQCTYHQLAQNEKKVVVVV